MKDKGIAMFRMLAAALALTAVAAAAAPPLEGERTVYLTDRAGERTAVADLSFSPDGDGATYTITMREGPFTDHFLSMRPFKCLEGASKHWCHVPYPYEIRRRVTAEDLTDLEYDLLFIWKGAAEYGINMWNGVYYQLKMDGGRITGSISEMDMDKLAVPPDAGVLRPIRAQDVEEGDPDSHWLPFVVVE